MNICKISSAFVLPMTFDNCEDVIYDADGDIIFNLGNFAVDGELAVYAINEHDKLVEQVEKLRSELLLAHSWLNIDNEYWASPLCESIIKTLEETC